MKHFLWFITPSLIGLFISVYLKSLVMLIVFSLLIILLEILHFSFKKVHIIISKLSIMQLSNISDEDYEKVKIGLVQSLNWVQRWYFYALY